MFVFVVAFVFEFVFVFAFVFVFVVASVLVDKVMLKDLGVNNCGSAWICVAGLSLFSVFKLGSNSATFGVTFGLALSSRNVKFVSCRTPSIVIVRL